MRNPFLPRLVISGALCTVTYGVAALSHFDMIGYHNGVRVLLFGGIPLTFLLGSIVMGELIAFVSRFARARVFTTGLGVVVLFFVCYAVAAYTSPAIFAWTLLRYVLQRAALQDASALIVDMDHTSPVAHA